MPALLVALIALAGCAAERNPADRSPAAQRRDGGGALFLYVQPLPPEADGLRVEIGGLAAVPAASGAAVPLVLRSAVLDGSAERRQRLLGWADLPAGRYAGISIDVRSATLAGSRGSGALAVPGESRMLETPLVIERGAAVVRTLRLQAGASVSGGYAFEPVFTAAAPGELAPEATAVTTVPARSALAVFHKLRGEVFDVLRTAERPTAAVYDPARRRAFVAGSAGDVVEVYDLDRGLREQVFPLLLGDRPSGLARTRDGRTLLTVNPGSATVTVLDAPVLAERFRVPLGKEPVAAVVSPDDRSVFVFDRGADSIFVIDPRLGSVRGVVAVEDGPVYGAFSARGDRLLVIHEGSPNLLAVDLGTLTVTRRAYAGLGATAIAVDPRTDRIHLARRGTGEIEVFDPQSLLPIDTIPTGGDVTFMTIDSDSDHLYAAVAGEVRIIRPVDGRTAAVAELGGDPGWIDVSGSR